MVNEYLCAAHRSTGAVFGVGRVSRVQGARALRAQAQGAGLTAGGLRQVAALLRKLDINGRGCGELVVGTALQQGAAAVLLVLMVEVVVV